MRAAISKLTTAYRRPINFIRRRRTRAVVFSLSSSRRFSSSSSRSSSKVGSRATPSTTMSASMEGNDDKTTNDPLTQYVVVRRDLWRDKGWSIGSICVQVAHASVAAIADFPEREETKQYVSLKNLKSMTKVVLEVKGETQLESLSEKLRTNDVEHHCWREQPEDYLTCLATRPYKRSEIKGYFKKANLASDVFSSNVVKE